LDKTNIGVFVGSARRESYSKKIATAIAQMMPADFTVKTIEISDLPLFNQDYDDDNTIPEQWLRFRSEVKELDGFLFVTPEYNRSVTPLMKNALDIASRPFGSNLWDGKPGAIIGVSPGSLGAFGSVQHLRQTLNFLNIYMMPQPEVFIAKAADSFDEDGKLSPRTEKLLARTAAAVADWCKRFS
jgi:chromate reductase